MNAADLCIPDLLQGPDVITEIFKVAQKLKFQTLILVSESPFSTPLGLTIIKGTLISAESIGKADSMIVNAKKKEGLIIVQAGENAFNRSIAGFTGVDILHGIHRTPKNSFDEVIARIVAKKGIIVDLSLFPVIHGEEKSRQKTLSKYREIVKFQRKFKFPISVSTGAEVSLDMRSIREFFSLSALFGLNDDEVKSAFSAIMGRMERPSPVSFVT